LAASDLQIEARRLELGTKRFSYWLLPHQALPREQVPAVHEEERKESA